MGCNCGKTRQQPTPSPTKPREGSGNETDRIRRFTRRSY